MEHAKISESLLASFWATEPCQACSNVTALMSLMQSISRLSTAIACQVGPQSQEL